MVGTPWLKQIILENTGRILHLFFFLSDTKGKKRMLQILPVFVCHRTYSDQGKGKVMVHQFFLSYSSYKHTIAFHSSCFYPVDICALGAFCLKWSLLEQRSVEALLHPASLRGLIVIMVTQPLMFTPQMLMNANSLDKKSVKMASVWIRSQVTSATANKAHTMTLLSSSALVSLFKVVLSP